MENILVRTADNFFVVGAAGAGGDLLQNLYGMYLREVEGADFGSNLQNAVNARKVQWNSLQSTCLGFCPWTDISTMGSFIFALEAGQLTSHNFIRMHRDEKDVLTHLWREHSVGMSFEDFLKEDMGYSLLDMFNRDSKLLTYALDVSYENLVENTHTVLTKVIDHLSPKTTDSYGKIRKEVQVNFEAINKVVDDSGIRNLRKGSGSNLLEKVDVYADWIEREQAASVDAHFYNV